MGLLHTIHHTARVQKERAFLSQSEIKKVMKAPCAYPLLKEAFSLSILTGLRKSDIFSLKAADLIKRDGIYYIKKTCVKTQQELIIPLSDEAEACLERSTGCRLAELDREKETPLFSALPSSRLNEKLRTWLKEAGITDKHITFHVASHNKIFY
nr:tyrosine-type recombinase/integrase [Segatella copri]